jgi:hypothetical protein
VVCGWTRARLCVVTRPHSQSKKCATCKRAAREVKRLAREKTKAAREVKRQAREVKRLAREKIKADREIEREAREAARTVPCVSHFV